jgi:uncharacterized delta-60 repeat protein
MSKTRTFITAAIALAMCLCWGASTAQADPGSLDLGFGVQGIALTEFGTGVDKAAAMAIQSDGKYIVAGVHESLEPDVSLAKRKKLVTLARFNIDGTLDPTFGSAGKVMVNLSEQWRATIGHNPTFRGVADIVILPADGRIVVASGFGGDNDYVGDLGLACFKANGELDTSFGNQGLVAIDSQPWSLPMSEEGWEHRLAVRLDGKLMFACTLETVYKRDFAVYCLNPDGSIDQSFGSSGRRIIDVTGGSDDNLTFMKRTADGRILLGGSVQHRDTLLARLTSDGALDASFGSGGKLAVVGTSDDRPVCDVALFPDGGFIALGTRGGYLRRHAANGTLDPSFGTGGRVPLGEYDVASTNPKRVALQPDGGIIISGTRDSGFPSYNDIWVSRRAANGALDTGFGVDGQMVTDLGGADDCAAMAIGPDGKLVVAGYALGSALRTSFSATPVHRASTARVGMGLARYEAGASPRHGAFRTVCKKAAGKKGRAIALRFKVVDNLCSKTKAVKLTIKNAKRKTVMSFTWKSVPTNVWQQAKWKPKAKGAYKYAVTAKDLSGHPQVKLTWSKIVVR